MKFHTTITMALLCLLSVYAVNGSAAPSEAFTVAKPQIKQSSSGCGSPNIDENSGSIQIKVTCHNTTVLGQKTRMTSLEINRERLLLAQNPTELRITNAYLRSWLPDGQRISLTLEVENPRNIPIPEIEIDFLDPASGASIPELKPIPFTRSQVYREVGAYKFSLAAGGKTALPVAFLDEIVNQQPHDSDLCAFDAALTMETPSSDTPPNNPVQPNGSKRSQHRALLVRARFISIFGQELSWTQWLWIVYGRGSDGMQFWYPSKKRWGTLTCAI